MSAERGQRSSGRPAGRHHWHAAQALVKPTRHLQHSRGAAVLMQVGRADGALTPAAAAAAGGGRGGPEGWSGRPGGPCRPLRLCAGKAGGRVAGQLHHARSSGYWGGTARRVGGETSSELKDAHTWRASSSACATAAASRRRWSSACRSCSAHASWLCRRCPSSASCQMSPARSCCCTRSGRGSQAMGGGRGANSAASSGGGTVGAASPPGSRGSAGDSSSGLWRVGQGWEAGVRGERAAGSRRQAVAAAAAAASGGGVGRCSSSRHTACSS